MSARPEKYVFQRFREHSRYPFMSSVMSLMAIVLDSANYSYPTRTQ